MRQAARTFQDLIVWQKAHRFVLSVYRITNEFPKSIPSPIYEPELITLSLFLAVL